MKKVFYCPACGYAGDAPDRSRRCPKCGQKLSSMLLDEKTRTALTEGESQPGRPAGTASTRNTVASLLKWIAAVDYLLALIAGIVLLLGGQGVAWLYMLPACFASGTLFLGVGELIQVTQDGFARLAELLRDKGKEN